MEFGQLQILVKGGKPIDHEGMGVGRVANFVCSGVGGEVVELASCLFAMKDDILVTWMSWMMSYLEG